MSDSHDQQVDAVDPSVERLHHPFVEDLAARLKTLDAFYDESNFDMSFLEREFQGDFALEDWVWAELRPLMTSSVWYRRLMAASLVSSLVCEGLTDTTVFGQCLRDGRPTPLDAVIQWLAAREEYREGLECVITLELADFREDLVQGAPVSHLAGLRQELDLLRECLVWETPETKEFRAEVSQTLADLDYMAAPLKQSEGLLGGEYGNAIWLTPLPNGRNKWWVKPLDD